ncbi:MAG: trigger factor [Oscillatoriaceae bacterium SKW80]|nr:trigger factor [Oscillatoriaceae bacterium SKYG93]MCX8120863.1 trigger factor [Oscillatoriaceae bacterium SKW80]MDW8454204.1 trigger factor [Oscillatoriaceae cyanobacterium SKYGB_i_bin93]HIK26471.1 trigger factor [Oscillatoriaceae cyanobacterium M7585_C2015_266]
MKVTQEKLPASKIGLEIEIPPEMSQKAYERVIQELSRTINIPGFRKGKVPRHVLLQRVGTPRIKAAALEELIQKGIDEAIKQESIAALGNYQLRSSFEELIGKYQPGQPLVFSATVDVEPEVKINQYKGLSVKVEEVKYDPAQVERVLEEKRSQQATLIPVEGRAAQLGDVAIVDYVGRFAATAEGETPKEIPGGKAEHFQIELVEGRFIEGFIKGIVGMQPGETKEISVDFPSDYIREELAGKSAIFTITLQELKEKELPALDDDFAKEVSDFQTLAELRESLEKKFQEEAEKKTKANQKEAVVNELLNHVEIEIPETLIEREIDIMIRQTALQLGSYGLDINKIYTKENVAEMRKRLRPEASDRVKKSLALKEIAKLESIEVEASEIDARLEEVMRQLAGEPIDAVKLREYISSELLIEKTTNWLVEQAIIELVPEGSLTQTAASENQPQTTVTEGISAAEPSQPPENPEMPTT